MTRNEYIKLATEAKRSGIHDRWIPLRDGAGLAIVTSCKFCDIKDKLQMECSIVCPFVTCHGWNLFRKWMNALPNSKQERKAAQEIIDFLKAFDPGKWADHLIEIGVLQP